MTNSKISIIVPIYNQVSYLKKCIDTIINQTYKNIEIIFVDDGSTDGSGKICDEYANKDKRIKVIHKKNEGVSVARNVGMRNATGDYIMFVDDDDYIDNDCIENCIDLLVKSNLDILKFQYAKESGILKKKNSFSTIKANTIIEKKDYEKEIYRKILDSNDLCNVWGTFYKTQLIKSIEFDKNLKNGEDYLFNTQAICRSQNFLALNKPYYHYIVNPNSVTHKKENLAQTINKLKMTLDVFYRIGSIVGISKENVEKSNKYNNEILCAAVSKIRKNDSFKLYKEQNATLLNDIVVDQKILKHINSYKFYIYSKIKKTIKEIIL